MNSFITRPITASPLWLFSAYLIAVGSFYDFHSAFFCCFCFRSTQLHLTQWRSVLSLQQKASSPVSFRIYFPYVNTLGKTWWWRQSVPASSLWDIIEAERQEKELLVGFESRPVRVHVVLEVHVSATKPSVWALVLFILSSTSFSSHVLSPRSLCSFLQKPFVPPSIGLRMNEQ